METRNLPRSKKDSPTTATLRQFRVLGRQILINTDTLPDDTLEYEDDYRTNGRCPLLDGLVICDAALLVVRLSAMKKEVKQEAKREPNMKQEPKQEPTQEVGQEVKQEAKHEQNVKLKEKPK